jgi:hypothetical protein
LICEKAGTANNIMIAKIVSDLPAEMNLFIL